MVSHYVTSSTTATATSSQWGDAGQWHITRVIRLLSALLGPRPCVSRARTPSSICARGLPPSGPAGNRCRVLSRSCPAYVPCSCCDSTVLDCSRRCDGIERCATSSRAVLRPRADVSTSSSHSHRPTVSPIYSVRRFSKNILIRKRRFQFFHWLRLRTNISRIYEQFVQKKRKVYIQKSILNFCQVPTVVIIL